MNQSERLLKPWYCVWGSAHIGKWWKRRLHKAERAYVKGYGRERSVRRYASEVNWKGM